MTCGDAKAGKQPFSMRLRPVNILIMAGVRADHQDAVQIMQDVFFPVVSLVFIVPGIFIIPKIFIAIRTAIQPLLPPLPDVFPFQGMARQLHLSPDDGSSKAGQEKIPGGPVRIQPGRKEPYSVIQQHVPEGCKLLLRGKAELVAPIQFPGADLFT